MAASTNTANPSHLYGSVKELVRRRWLVYYFIKRQLAQNYRGSLLGFAWIILSPLIMVGLYTLIFSKIIGIRFGHANGVSNYGLYVYCGLLPFYSFSTVLGRGAGIVRSNASLVTRVLFPLEILPLATAATAFITQMVSFCALLALTFILEGHLPLTLLLLPIIAVPQILFLTGLSCFTSVAGAYVPDFSETMTAINRIMLFITPILWPVSRLPDRYRWIVDLNPLAFLVTSYRHLVLIGTVPGIKGLAIFWLFCAVFALLGAILFVRTKRQFADVV